MWGAEFKQFKVRFWRRALPLIVAGGQFIFFLNVLVRRMIWPVGDATDVLVPAVAALPWGGLAVFFPGGRNGAYVFVFLLGLLNAIFIWAVVRAVLNALATRKTDSVLGLRHKQPLR
jgi:hypothetical protein